MAPLETRSPTTLSVPPEVTLMAVPGAPPQPPRFSAAMVGAYRRLLTPLEAVADRTGGAPLVRMRANCNGRVRFAVMAKPLPCGPRLDTTCVSAVPSEYVQVTVRGAAPGVPYPGEQDGAM